ncbi:hypothetical protein O6H91_10G036300 [Diphasiastrum complanatum]|uniref:Uncharacterized protein n=1 Tax=Diphasiastrum complanatum TaxID=34168 RepID=A0ACC2CG79_DIPCM|nr:hypothetical protein O6H91_10G036300 [Diphasiastrum complanatum]
MALSEFRAHLRFFLPVLFYHLCSHFWPCVFGDNSSAGGHIEVQSVSVEVNGLQSIAAVDESFICATLDWWPPQKCDYGSCSWGNASILNLDLQNPILQSAVKALSPLMIRLGGTLQDRVIYDVGNIQRPCRPLIPGEGLFNYVEGCLSLRRWQALNEFFQKTGSIVAFGLNALYGRHLIGRTFSGSWDSSNAQEFIQYTFNKSYQILAWELGNELSTPGVGGSIPTSQYARDIKKLRAIVDGIYKTSSIKPLIGAPDGFFNARSYQQLLQLSGPRTLDVCTRHIYNLGPGVDKNLVNKILNPFYLSKEAGAFKLVQQTLLKYGPWAHAWIGEAGGAYNSGRNLVSNAFVSSFWYVDQLGMAAQFNNKAYCRQSLIGGNYGLLDTNTFHPNPDYYSALLWKKLMGKVVLSASLLTHAPYLRAYAHCSTDDPKSIAIVLINLSTIIQFEVDLLLSISGVTSISSSRQMMYISGVLGGKIKSGEALLSEERLEYHLTAPKGNDVQSRIVLLNGEALHVTPENKIPVMAPIKADNMKPIVVAPLSIVFAVVSAVGIPACSETLCKN